MIICSTKKIAYKVNHNKCYDVALKNRGFKIYIFEMNFISTKTKNIRSKGGIFCFDETKKI